MQKNLVKSRWSGYTLHMQKMIRASLSLAAQAKLEKAKREMFLGKKRRPVTEEMRKAFEKASREYDEKYGKK